MTKRIVVVKVVLTLVGAGVFAFGIRTDDAVVRWVGIACIVAAFLLRFVEQRFSP